MHGRMVMTHIDYHELGALLSCGNRVDFFLKRLASSGFVFFMIFLLLVAPLLFYGIKIFIRERLDFWVAGRSLSNPENLVEDMI